MYPTAPSIGLEVGKVNDAQAWRVKWIEGFIIGEIGLVRPVLKRFLYQTAQEMEKLLVGIMVDSPSNGINQEFM